VNQIEEHQDNSNGKQDEKSNQNGTEKPTGYFWTEQSNQKTKEQKKGHQH